MSAADFVGEFQSGLLIVLHVNVVLTSGKTNSVEQSTFLGR